MITKHIKSSYTNKLNKTSPIINKHQLSADPPMHASRLEKSDIKKNKNKQARISIISINSPPNIMNIELTM